MSSSTSKKPSLSLFVSPSSPPIPSSSQLPSLPSSSNELESLRKNQKSRDLSPTSTSSNHLSSSTYYPSYDNGVNSSSNERDSDRRITSWGSAVSDSLLLGLSHSNNELNFSTNTLLHPSGSISPELESRNWNTRGSSSSSTGAGAGSGLGESVLGSAGFTMNDQSVFSEFRDSSTSYNGSGAGIEDSRYLNQSTTRSNGGSFSSTTSSNAPLSQTQNLSRLNDRNPSFSSSTDDLPSASLTRYPSLASNTSRTSRTPSGRSKTMSFFDEPNMSQSPTPPPNPLSRNSSLNTSVRGGGKRGSEVDSPRDSPEMTPMGREYQLPKLPNLPPLLVPFSTYNSTSRASNSLSTSTDAQSSLHSHPNSPPFISPTYSNFSATSTSSSNQPLNQTTPNMMSTLPTAISPPRGYKNRFDAPPIPSDFSYVDNDNDNDNEVVDSSQVQTPTLTYPSSQQVFLPTINSNSTRFETLNATWAGLDSPPYPSSSGGGGNGDRTSLPFAALKLIPPTPTFSAFSSTSATSSEVNQVVEAEEDKELEEGDLIGSWEVLKVLGRGSFSRVMLARESRKEKGKEKEERGREEEGEKVALKLILRKSYEGNERMRISVVREVEVLKHIHHPSLTTLLSSFSTPLYTVLVLDYSSGGELFDFLAEWQASLEEDLARRIFGELCDAVGWMHEIGLIHRDIKLENILLTSRPFPNSLPQGTSVLSILPTPFIKLTDFGLSRFIPLPLPSSTTSTFPSSSSSQNLETHPSQLLTTRCGSESYAAPELIMGKQYDGRKTDAWALGVVLFAIGSGGMPFIEVPDHDSVQYEDSAGGGGAKLGKSLGNREGRRGGRKAFLIKIAKGEFNWPDEVNLSGGSSSTSMEEITSSNANSSFKSNPAFRLLKNDFKNLVTKLLTRDPNRRLIVNQVWDQPWFKNQLDGSMKEGTPRRVKGWVGGRS